jgi:hypothetical protein
MHKIELPFSWSSKLPSITLFAFPVDIEKLSSLDIEPDEYPGFFIDLKDGSILGVSEEISSGKAYRYPHNGSHFIEGKGWWYAYDESNEEEYFKSPDSEIKNIFSKNNFDFIVDSICEYARKNNLSQLKCDNLYINHINNDDSPVF